MSNTKSLFFDGVTYSAADMVSYLAALTSNGVLMTTSDSMQATLTTEGNIHVSGGTSYINGYCHILGSDGATVTPGADVTAGLLVLQLDTVNKKFSLSLKANQTEAGTNEIPLAAYSVTGSTASLTDKRNAVVFKIQAAANDNKVTYATYDSVTFNANTYKTDFMAIDLPVGDYKYHDITVGEFYGSRNLVYFVETGQIIVMHGIGNLSDGFGNISAAYTFKNGKIYVSGRQVKYNTSTAVYKAEALWSKVVSIR